MTDQQLVLSTLITLLTPGIVGILKGVIPQGYVITFKRFVPAIPPIIGALLGVIGNQLGIHILPGLTDAISGLLIGALSSSGYDLVKAQRKQGNG